METWRSHAARVIMRSNTVVSRRRDRDDAQDIKNHKTQLWKSQREKPGVQDNKPAFGQQSCPTNQGMLSTWQPGDMLALMPQLLMLEHGTYSTESLPFHGECY
jgi:hypothetical protein